MGGKWIREATYDMVVDLSNLHPDLRRIYLEKRPKKWQATITLGCIDYYSHGETALEALVILLNNIGAALALE